MCTHLNAIFMLNPNIAMKIYISTILGKFVMLSAERVKQFMIYELKCETDFILFISLKLFHYF